MKLGTSKKRVLLLVGLLMMLAVNVGNTIYAADISAESNMNKPVTINYLVPTGETKDEKSVYMEGGVYPEFEEILDDSFFSELMRIYQGTEAYSDLDLDTLNVVFQENSGCYGNVGFYIKHSDGTYEFREEPYIELNRSLLTNGEVTLIFSHELGHIMSKSIIKQGQDSKVLVMHYSTVMTDYHTAFTEGYGEHFEYIGTKYEKNKDRKDALLLNYRDERGIQAVMNKLKKDFILPGRLDYYRILYPLYQGKYEDANRYYSVLEETAKYQNEICQDEDADATGLYRNMGVDKTGELSEQQQNMSKESVIAAFFAKLIENGDGELSQRYQKVFTVFSQMENMDVPELIQFVELYIDNFPEEKKRLLQVYKNSVGYDFTGEYAPEIWLYIEGSANFIILDQFDSITIPFHTINLNTAYVSDLLTIDGITKEEAEAIVAYRKENGYFQRIEELDNVPGIKEDTITLLTKLESEEQQKKTEELGKNEGFNLNATSLIVSCVVHFVCVVHFLFLLFTIVFGVIKIGILKQKKGLIKCLIGKYFKFIFLTSWGLASVLASNVLYITALGGRTYNPIPYFAVGAGAVLIVNRIVLRKKKAKFLESILTTAAMCLMVIYSFI